MNNLKKRVGLEVGWLKSVAGSRGCSGSISWTRYRARSKSWSGSWSKSWSGSRFVGRSWSKSE